MSTKEIWKDIPNYEGYYQVSSFGRVKSCSRSIIGLNAVQRTLKEKILKAGIGTYGYYNYRLFKDGKGKTFRAHKLVAMAFLNHKPSGYEIIVDHINNIKTDNRVENLQLTSPRHNASKDTKSTSKYTGVSWAKEKNKWLAQIHINGKKKYLGRFDCELAAAKAYQDKLKEIL
jgi:hypothetical protein